MCLCVIIPTLFISLEKKNWFIFASTHKKVYAPLSFGLGSQPSTNQNKHLDRLMCIAYYYYSIEIPKRILMFKNKEFFNLNYFLKKYLFYTKTVIKSLWKIYWVQWNCHVPEIATFRRNVLSQMCQMSYDSMLIKLTF